MQALTNLDTSFLHIENKSTPMHVGGVMLFSAPSDGAMNFKRFRHHVSQRLQTARIFRQRLSATSSLIDNPVWIEDPKFNIDNHLRCNVQVGELTNEALEELSSHYFSVPLRQNQPLWQLLFIRTANPEDGFALMFKAHHCALDGISAEAVLIGLLDASPQPRPMPKDTWQAEPMPSFLHTLNRRVASLKQSPQRIKALLNTSGSVAKNFAIYGVLAPKTPRYFTAPKTPFNCTINNKRSHLSVQLSLPQIKAIKSTWQGLTINDVVLAICAGATRRYLEESGALPNKSLIAMAPVSRRSEDEKGLAGNKVSSMLIKLATDIADPIERLHAIHDNTKRAKAYNRDVPVDVLMDLLPTTAPALVLKTYAALRLGRVLPPVFNMVITNVAGSPKPLYFDGAMMRSVNGMVGLTDGMALTFMVMSYCDNLSISITTAPQAIANPKRLAQCLQEANDELAQLLLAKTYATNVSAVVVSIHKNQEKAA